VDKIDWPLHSEPAIRWQAIRDLTDTSPALVQFEHKRVANEGLGTEILAKQEPDGALRRDNAPAWLTTLFTLQLLRAAGVNSADPAVQEAVARFEAGLRKQPLRRCSCPRMYGQRHVMKYYINLVFSFRQDLRQDRGFDATTARNSQRVSMSVNFLQ
jgi:hypothetical protein